MTTRNWRQYIFLATIVGCIQFVLLTFIAMLFYPGGTHDNPAAKGYSFFNNFFSDLGLTVTPSGETTTISFTLFTLSLTLAGLAIILFFTASTALFKNTARENTRLAWLHCRYIFRVILHRYRIYTSRPVPRMAWELRAPGVQFLPPGSHPVYHRHLLEQGLSKSICLCLPRFRCPAGGISMAAVRRTKRHQDPGHWTEGHRLCRDYLHVHPGLWRLEHRKISINNSS